MLTFDMWPDVSEYTHKYAVPGFTHPDGTQAFLYSAMDQQTVDKHFDWMQQYGIDGVVVQRFVTQTPSDNVQAWKSNVLRYVRAAANRTGRVFCLEYDMSGANTRTLFGQMTNDWICLADDLKLTQDPRYLHHDGKPVLMIFGFYPERFPDTAVPKQIIAWFKTNATCSVTLIGSGWWYWRFAGMALGILGALGLAFCLPTFSPRWAWWRGLLVPAIYIVAITLISGTWLDVAPLLRRVPLYIAFTVISLFLVLGASKLRIPRWNFLALTVAVWLGGLLAGAQIFAFFISLFALILSVGTLLGVMAAHRGSRRAGDIALAIFMGYALGQWIPIMY